MMNEDQIRDLVQSLSIDIMERSDGVVLTFAFAIVCQEDGLMIGDSSTIIHEDVSNEKANGWLLTALRGFTAEMEYAMDVPHKCPPPNN